MAKYHVQHSCGHTETYNLVGKVNRRQPRADWLAGQPCKECKAAEGRALLAEAGINLTGSQKQIAWAEKIVMQMLDNHRSRRALVMDALKAIPAEAGWIIDNRDNLQNVTAEQLANAANKA